ncbi:MAG: copper resistance protein CopC [Candidatus Phosphoribacter sp.]|nr:copper resistance protein CopC [Actinomycetales bacterium]
MTSRLTGALVPLASAVLALAPLPAAAHPLQATYAVAPVPAHSELSAVVPADGSVLDRGPRQISLTFNEDINPRFAQLALTRSGVIVTLGSPTVTGKTLAATLADPGPGSYRIAFRVVSADGHPISGETKFSVTGTASGTASVPAPSAPTASTSVAPSAPSASNPVAPSAPSMTAPSVTSAQEAGTPSGSSEGILWIGLGGGLLAVALGLGIWARRNRGKAPQAGN